MGGRKKCTAGATAILPVTSQLQTSGWRSAKLSALCHLQPWRCAPPSFPWTSWLLASPDRAP